MDKILMLECVIMGIILIWIVITWVGYVRDKKRREREK
jgi:hypothetical protein